MRNLKRALSLALASVMLLGMMVVGTSAASTSGFTDADKISNAEAVDLTTGLGIFKGYTDGSFGPEKAVTRAEAAVVIAKILHGSDVNPANFAGAGKFTDVEAWAEGYVNLVSSLGIIVGRGEGIFDPNATVTTVEFSTMLLKALGYYVEADALGADWMLEVTSKANALGLYGDLELSMTAPLTRENVAVLTMNALFAQRVAYDDVRGLYVKNSDRNVVVTNGTEDEYNTLAQNTYGLYAVDGLVTDNGYTDIDLDGKTLVVFEDDKDVTGDKKVESEYKFAVASDLNLIGHAVTVYYTIEKKAPVVYAIADQATLVVETFMKANLTTLAKDKGFDRDTTDTQVIKNYVLTDVVDHEDYTSRPAILISNNNDLTVDYAIILDQDLDYVTKVTTDDNDEDNIINTYKGVTESYVDEENVVAVGEIEKGDYIIVTPINDLYVIEAAKTETAILNEIDRDYTTTDTLYTDDVAYSKARVEVLAKLADKDNVKGGECDETYAVTDYANVAVEGEYVLIYDAYDRLIGTADIEEDEVINVAYVAQFGYKINTAPSLNDKYALTAHVYFADGTDAVYYVDNTDGIFDDVTVNSKGDLEDFDVDTVEDLNDLTGVGYGDYIKLWDVDVDAEDGTVVIDALEVEDYTTVEQIKKGVTWMGEDLYGNSETIFFFVIGEYDDDLVVGIETGMKNVPTIFEKGETVDAVVAQTASTVKNEGESSEYAVVDAALVSNYEYDTTESGIYYYDEEYTITRVASDKYTLTYKMYDITTGEEYAMVYAEEYSKYSKAKETAESHEAGYYEDDGDDIVLVKVGEPEYVVENKFEDYIDLGDTLTMYTIQNAKELGVTVDEDTIFVDLTGNSIASLEDLDERIAKNQTTWDNAYKAGDIKTEKTVVAYVSYVFDEDDNLADIVFITSVTGKYTKDYADLEDEVIEETGAEITSVTVSGLTIAVEYTSADETAPSASEVVAAIRNELGDEATKVVLKASDEGYEAEITSADDNTTYTYAVTVAKAEAEA